MLSDDEMLKLCGCEASSPTALVVLAIGRAVERAAYERAAALVIEMREDHVVADAIRALGRQND